MQEVNLNPESIYMKEECGLKRHRHLDLYRSNPYKNQTESEVDGKISQNYLLLPRTILFQ